MKTFIGDVRFRTDIPARGTTADGKERVFLNLVPDTTFHKLRMSGKYKYWRAQPYEGAEHLAHQWIYFNPTTDKWEEVRPRSGDLLLPGQLQWGLEDVAHDLDCDVFVSFDEEFLDPNNPQDRATRCCIYLFGLTEVRNNGRFIEAVATRIDREARRWTSESSDWSIEDI